MISRLINGLSHSNKGNIEVSLNSSSVLVELIEIEKTFELFFANDSRFIRRIVELAIDPSNDFNQKYLLHILLIVCKNLKPQSNNIFKDLDDDDDEKKKLDPESNIGKMVLKFMAIIKETQLLYNLLLIINTKGTGDDDYIMNQFDQRIPKFGQARLRSLELMNSIFSILHPSHGPLAAAQLLAENQPNPDGDHIEEFQLSTYLPTHLRRQVLNTMLFVMKNFNYCSIANQMSILIIDNIKSQLDVIDIVSMQKFVINEFANRHHAHHQLIVRQQEEGIDRPIRRY